MSLEPSKASGVFSSIEEVIEDAARGKVFVLLDDEDRENEGDLVALADRISADAINLMIRSGSGIVCLALSDDLGMRLGLGLLPRRNAGESCPAFTVSIDARYGITTGVSARDRANTILAAVSSESSADDLVTPGHVFPIIARNGGVVERAGHTEAGVDIAKLAGAAPAAVICELMNSDGSMARLPEIMKFAAKENLRVTTIKMLVAYLGCS